MRTIWILSEKTWTAVETGPHRRVRSLANSALLQGHTVHVACPDWKYPPPAGIQPENLESSLLDRIPRDDLVIASPFLPALLVAKILRSNHELHVDFYCVSAMEALESSHRYPFWRLHQGRIRTWRRYLLLLRRCSRFYLSTSAQLFFLAGTLFSRIGTGRDRWLSDLPLRGIIAPMGVPSPADAPVPTPYPNDLCSRPIFLWGGGIWEWLDADFLIRAFAEIEDKDTGPVLYFLAGTNPSGEASQDLAPLKAIRLAKTLGVLGRNVWFHPNPVGPNDLPGFLSHCRAGIMANLENLESLASWRTRYLDLVSARKPLLVHRTDPLAKILAASGVAKIAENSDPKAFAARVLAFMESPIPEADSVDWGRIQSELSDQALLDSVCRSWSIRHPTPDPPGFHSVLRWLLGL